MRFLPNSEQMKAADSYTIHHLGIPSLELMEKAAMACVSTLLDKQINLNNPLVVCGSGNNGGDGFAIARILLNKGYYCKVLFAGKMESRSVETKQQMEWFEEAGGSYCNQFEVDEYTVVIDALFGVGLNRDIQGRYGELIEQMNQVNCYKFAVDTPSGVCATTGKIFAHAFQADTTVTFQNAKIGLMLYPGKNFAGEVIVKDIGISNDIYESDLEVAFTVDIAELKKYMPARKEDSHKGSYGKTLIIAGCKGMSGAAYLNAYAAYMAGAGLVQIYTVEENRQVLQQLLPEAIITTYDFYDEKEVIRLLRWADVVAIGSGIGMSDKSRKILRTVLENVTVPCVIDADGLNLIAENPKYMTYLNKGDYILTPHMKEMSRITEYTISELKQDKNKRLKEFVEKYSVTCVMKDARTLVAKAGERMYLNLSGNSAMAKGGSGDVLTGVIAGLLSQGMKTFDAAWLGVFLHGCSGDKAREAKGAYSVLARDLAENLSAVLKGLED